MQRQSLVEIYHQHKQKVSDKWSLYLHEYNEIFERYRDLPISILEIGIQNGGSLEIYDKYFQEAKLILGCDIDSKCNSLQYDSKKICVVVGDANLPITKDSILKHSLDFDIIIDDASHTSGDIIKLFCNYFETLNYGGIYIIEDLHCSYWQEYDGGLFHPYSAQSFFTKLIDILNHESWGLLLSGVDFLHDFISVYDLDIPERILHEIHSIKFVNSACFIYKARSYNNHIGTQVVVGSYEDIVQGRRALDGSSLPVPSQEYSPWSEPGDHYRMARYKLTKKFSGELDACKGELDACKGELDACKEELDACKGELDACKGELDACKGELDACKGELNDKDTLLISMQTTLETIKNIKGWKAIEFLKKIKALLSSSIV